MYVYLILFCGWCKDDTIHRANLVGKDKWYAKCLTCEGIEEYTEDELLESAKHRRY